MNIPYLIQVLQNKITALGNAKSQAFSIGDLEQLAIIEKELYDTQNTFSQLVMLSEVTQAAAATNVTPAELFASGLETKQNTVTIQGPSASAVVQGYDISAYATDPLHEQKIQNLIAAMPPFNSLVDIDAYIQSAAPGSPVTGQMVQNAITLYPIDMLLLLAIMQNDSNFGTLGIGARTYNPGNVGNNGFEERSYPSWEEGVVAVAQWLSRHRASMFESVVPQPVVVEEPAVIAEPIVEKVVKPKKKKAVSEEPEPEPEIPPIEPPAEEGTTTPPIVEDTASTTPPVVVDEPIDTASSTEPTP